MQSGPNRLANADAASYGAFFAAAGHLSLEKLEQLAGAAEAAQRSIGEQFLLNEDETEMLVPRRLDPIPYMIGNREWQTIEAGLQQRARLLDCLLQDLLGPQTLLRSKTIPEEVVLRHPDFLRAAVRQNGEPVPPLSLHGADLARGPDGRIWVLKDRIQGPKGLGSLIECRTILAKLFPGVIKQLQLKRLAPGFRAFRASLLAQAPSVLGQRSPRVVVQTPGIFSPTYFEHAYLATYLGYTLVQGADLLVRDGRVQIKGLDGLQDVDVMLRYVKDQWSDPLELREDSSIGLAGITEAARRGTVSLVNPIGSAILENRALLPFLPSACQALLGENLLMPQVETWWCGQANTCRAVLGRLSELSIRTFDDSPVLMDGKSHPSPFYDPASYPGLVAAIQAEPWRFVAQTRIVPGAMPILSGRKMMLRPCSFRAFTFRNTDGFQVLPGGLAKTRQETSGTDLPSHDICVKDVWICDEQGQSQFQSLWQETGIGKRQDPVAGLFTSRTVENLYWCGRYGERAASLTRSLRVVVLHDEDLDPLYEEFACAPALWRGLMTQTGLPSDRVASEPSREKASALAADPNFPGGLQRALKTFHINAQSVRENWSQDTWQIISQLQQLTVEYFKNRDPRDLHADLALHLCQTMRLFQAFAGQCHEGMTRSPGWYFLDLGRNLERGMMMLDLLDGLLSAPESSDGIEPDVLDALLKVHESLISYRRTYRTEPELPTVLHQLLAEPTNPRSLHAILSRLIKDLDHIPKLVKSLEKTCLSAKLSEHRLTLKQLGGSKTGWQIQPLLKQIRDIQATLGETHQGVDELYFKHAEKEARLMQQQQQQGGDSA